MLAGAEWEVVLRLACEIDEGVAAGAGIQADDGLRLARAVLDFDQHLSDGAILVTARADDPRVEDDSGRVDSTSDGEPES
jgi:hypothetical protein